MNEQDDIRKQVSGFYGNSVTQGCGCCGPGLPQGVSVQTAGYDKNQLNVLPQDAVQNSFGCGNPLAFSEVEPGQTVLDLGSGAGIDLLIAAEKVGSAGKVIGVDMTDEMIAHARANIEKAGAGQVEIRKGIIEQLPVEDNSVDWVISNCVINLSPEKDKVFAEIARVLKPGGRISISDIVVEDLPGWVRESMTLYSACIGGAISEQHYLEGLKNAGLQQVEVAERFMYDLSQLTSLAQSEIPRDAFACCGGGAIPKEMVAGVAQALEGKIYSAKFVGRKG